MKNKAKWIQRQQEIVSAARAAGRGLTAEEQAEFDQLQRQIDAEPDGQGNGEPDNGQRGHSTSNGSNVPNLGTNPADVERQAQEAERQRASDIIALCRQAGMDPDKYVLNGDSVDKVREAAVDHLLKHGAPVVIGARDADQDNFRDAARDAMLMQAGVEVEKPAQGAEALRGMSLRDFLIESMARSGEGTTTELLTNSKDYLY